MTFLHALPQLDRVGIGAFAHALGGAEGKLLGEMATVTSRAQVDSIAARLAVLRDLHSWVGGQMVQQRVPTADWMRDLVDGSMIGLTDGRIATARRTLSALDQPGEARASRLLPSQAARMEYQSSLASTAARDSAIAPEGATANPSLRAKFDALFEPARAQAEGDIQRLLDAAAANTHEFSFPTIHDSAGRYTAWATS